MKVSAGPGRKLGMLPTRVCLPSTVGMANTDGTGMSVSSMKSSASPPLSERNMKSVLFA